MCQCQGTAREKMECRLRKTLHPKPLTPSGFCAEKHAEARGSRYQMSTTAVITSVDLER